MLRKQLERLLTGRLDLRRGQLAARPTCRRVRPGQSAAPCAQESAHPDADASAIHRQAFAMPRARGTELAHWPFPPDGRSLRSRLARCRLGPHAVVCVRVEPAPAFRQERVCPSIQYPRTSERHDLGGEVEGELAGRDESGRRLSAPNSRAARVARPSLTFLEAQPGSSRLCWRRAFAWRIPGLLWPPVGPPRSLSFDSDWLL
jgi:hypothetical protein